MMRVDLSRRSADGEALEPDRDERAGEHGERGVAHGASHTSLMDFCAAYLERFGNELCWPYPISDGKHQGTFLVLVREGILSLPYDDTDKEDYELFCLEDAAMFRFSGEMQNFIDDWRTFDLDLKQAMYAMFRYLKEQEETQNE